MTVSKLKLSKKSIVLSLNPPSEAKAEEKKENKVVKLNEKKPAAPKVAKAKNIKEHTIIDPDIYTKILRHFRAKYPNCFSRPRKLLAIGIFHELVEECEELGVSKMQLRHFFKAYCSTKHYRQLMIIGAERFGLNGEVTSLITEQEVCKPASQSINNIN